MGTAEAVNSSSCRNAVALRKLYIPEETHEAMSKVQAAMQEHFISFIRGDVPFEATDGGAMKYGPVGKVAVGWKKNNRNVRA